MNSVRFLLIAFLAIALAQVGYSQTVVYVDSTANCSTSCTGTPALPFPNLQGAYNALIHGGTINVMPGIYNGTQNTELSATVPITIISNDTTTSSTTIIDCEGTASGLSSSGSNLTVQGVTIQNCQGADGGAMHIDSGTFTHIVDVIFRTNQASDDGGAISQTGGFLFVTGSTFVFNSATSSGGAIWVSGATLIITGGNYTNNTSPVGTLGCADAGNITLDATTSATANVSLCSNCKVQRAGLSVCATAPSTSPSNSTNPSSPKSPPVAPTPITGNDAPAGLPAMMMLLATVVVAYFLQ